MIREYTFRTCRRCGRQFVHYHYHICENCRNHRKLQDGDPAKLPTPEEIEEMKKKLKAEHMRNKEDKDPHNESYGVRTSAIRLYSKIRTGRQGICVFREK